jgi:hypothetical protein
MLAVIHHLADDGVGIGDLYEVKARFLSCLKRVFNRYYSNLATVGTNQSTLISSNIVVDRWAFLAASVIAPDGTISCSD